MQLIRIPKASENLEAATVGAWLKHEGDAVRTGEPVVEILTDKADFALEAEEDGIIRRTTVPEKSTVPVGFILAVIAPADATLPDIDAENSELLRQTPDVTRELRKTDRPARIPAQGRKIPATPAARRLAKEHGIDLAAVADKLGKQGVLSADDVEEFIRNR